MQKLRIGARILLTFVLLVGLLAVVLVAGLHALRVVGAASSVLADVRLPNYADVATFHEAQTDVARAALGNATDDTPDDRTDADRKVVAAMLAHEAASRALDPLVDALLRVVRERARQEAAEAGTLVDRASITLTIAFLAVVGLALGLGWALARSIAGIFAAVAGKLDELAAGDLPAPISEARGDDFNRLRDSLNGVVTTLHDFVTQMKRMSDEHERGDIDVVMEEARFPGEFRAMAAGVNQMVGAHIAVKKEAMAIFSEFGKGNFDATLAPLPGKKRFINDTIEQVRGNLKALIAEMNRVSAEHERGEIDAAIDEARFAGDFRTMARGVNGMVGAHIAVKKKAIAVFSEFGKGNFDATLEPLPGKKRFINEAVEQVRGNLEALVADAAALSRAAVDGRLDARADVSRQPGGFRTIVQGVNDTLDALVAPMRDLAAVLGRIAGGDLSARADPSRYQHEARRLLEGVNETLSAMLAPVNEATQVLGQLARRDLQARMAGEYRGDHAAMKAAINSTAQALDDALSQVADAAEQVSSASTQIASSSQAVAAGASEQAASLTETTSGIASVSSIARQAAESAQQAPTGSRRPRAASRRSRWRPRSRRAASSRSRGRSPRWTRSPSRTQPAPRSPRAPPASCRRSPRSSPRWWAPSTSPAPAGRSGPARRPRPRPRRRGRRASTSPRCRRRPGAGGPRTRSPWKMTRRSAPSEPAEIRGKPAGPACAPYGRPVASGGCQPVWA